jgi:hypothetical protein
MNGSFGIARINVENFTYDVMSIYGPYDTEREADGIAQIRNSVESFNGNQYYWAVCEFHSKTDLD